MLSTCSGYVVQTRFDKACFPQKSSELAVKKLYVVDMLLWCSGGVEPRIFTKARSSKKSSELTVLNLDFKINSESSFLIKSYIIFIIIFFLSVLSQKMAFKNGFYIVFLKCDLTGLGLSFGKKKF